MRAVKVKSVERQRQLAEAALAIVDECGVPGLQIAAVAERVGLVPSAVYRHFRSRAELLEAVFELVGERLMGMVEGARGCRATPLLQLHEIFIRHTKLLVNQRAAPYLVFSGILREGHPGHGTALYRALAGYLTALGELVEEGQRAGEIRGDVNPQTTAILFLGMLLPTAVIYHLADGGYDMGVHVAAAWPQFVRGVAVDPGAVLEQSV